MADANTPTAPASQQPAGSPTQLRGYYLNLAIAQLHCALAALAVGDTPQLRTHLGRARAAIDHAERIR